MNHSLVLENMLNAQKHCWCQLDTLDIQPPSRVGHSALFVVVPPKSENPSRLLFLVGGANPSGTFKDVWMLDIKKLAWCQENSRLFQGRYEHAAISTKDAIYVFGGAGPDGNLDSMQKYCLETRQWNLVEAYGTVPSPRTQQYAAATRNKLIVYGGGDCGREPVTDSTTYSFDTASETWEAIETLGHQPCPRHGHIMVALTDSVVYLHGGMAGNTFFDDMHILDLESHVWKTVENVGSKPLPRAAHGGVSVGHNMYVFGGLGNNGMALDDLWCFDTVIQIWTSIGLEGVPPSPRLDFAMCVISLKELWPGNLQKLGDDEEPSDGAPDGQRETIFALFIHGGMDTEGNIFDDCFLCAL